MKTLVLVEKQELREAVAQTAADVSFEGAELEISAYGSASVKLTFPKPENDADSSGRYCTLTVGSQSYQAPSEQYLLHTNYDLCTHRLRLHEHEIACNFFRHLFTLLLSSANALIEAELGS